MKNMAIMRRILIGLSFVFLLMILIGVLAEVIFNKLEKQALEIIDKEVPMTDACMKIKLEVIMAHRIVEEVMTGAEEKSAIEEAYSMLDNAAWYAGAIINGGTNDEGVFLPASDSNLREDAQALTVLITDFKKASQERYDAKLGGSYNIKEWNDTEEAFDESFDNLVNIANDMEEIVKEKMSEGKTKLLSSAKNATFEIIGTTVLFMVISVITTVAILSKINNLLNEVTQKLSQSSRLVAVASEQLARSGQQLSSGSSKQAASIEETSATLEETASMVTQNTDNTRRANKQSKDASESATEGADKMKNMIESMDEIKKSSVEIAKIIKVIDDIAFQTNMLALNAAVEAARAGDAGQGFAVVAEEVRNLAGKSAQAAKDTAEIIDANIESSEQGVLTSEEVDASLERIMRKTESTNKLIEEITLASEEQSKGIDQVNIAVNQMESVVQQNAVSAEESAASAEELKNQADALKEIVFEINVLIRGRKKAQEKRVTLEETDNSIEASIESIEESKQITVPEDIIQLDGDDDFLIKYYVEKEIPFGNIVTINTNKLMLK